MSAVPKFENMSETDVREIYIRPFLMKLGYAHGTDANIRTDFSLRYNKAQLGRKNARDPDLPGARKPDYVCEVISHARFVVETKAGHHDLGEEDAYQAYTYASHPEIGALYFLVTNGREFRLYTYAEPTRPCFAWTFETLDENYAAIANVLGPDAIKRRALQLRPDTNKPLAAGFNSTAEIVGGLLTYGRLDVDIADFQSPPNMLEGARASVMGRRVHRDINHLITAEIELAGPYEYWNAVNRAVGWDVFTFSTAEEFISTDPDRPSILQNIIYAETPPGLRMPLYPGAPDIALPVPLKVQVFTQAVGFLEDRTFRGVFTNDYEMEISGVNGRFRLFNDGDFELRLR